ncbi:hypothetical protein BN439_3732 [Erwinia amylovora Ea644]|nr:hypothetical protein BN439_3732 [Erwinia amylovora Ea644]
MYDVLPPTSAFNLLLTPAAAPSLAAMLSAWFCASAADAYPVTIALI